MNVKVIIFAIPSTMIFILKIYEQIGTFNINNFITSKMIRFN